MRREVWNSELNLVDLFDQNVLQNTCFLDHDLCSWAPSSGMWLHNGSDRRLPPRKCRKITVLCYNVTCNINSSLKHCMISLFSEHGAIFISLTGYSLVTAEMSAASTNHEMCSNPRFA